MDTHFSYNNYPLWAEMQYITFFKTHCITNI